VAFCCVFVKKKKKLGESSEVWNVSVNPRGSRRGSVCWEALYFVVSTFFVYSFFPLNDIPDMSFCVPAVSCLTAVELLLISDM